MPHPGLYEQVINNVLNREFSEVPEACKSTAPIDTAEASKVLAQYLTDVVQKGLDNVQDNGGGIEAQIALANQIVSTIQTTTQEADFATQGVEGAWHCAGQRFGGVPDPSGHRPCRRDERRFRYSVPEISARRKANTFPANILGKRCCCTTAGCRSAFPLFSP